MLAIVTPDSLEQYIKSIKQYPSLSYEEECQYFKNYQEHNCIDSMYKIITSNLRFVVYVAYKYRGYKLPILDLIQEGNIGLMKAAKLFSIEKGARFVTYATHWIKEGMMNYIISNTGMVKFGTTKPRRKLFFNKSTVFDENNEVNNFDEISSKLNVSIEDIQAFLEYSQPTASLFDYDGEVVDLCDNVNYTEAYIEAEQQQFNIQQIPTLLSNLNERDRDVIQNRFLSSHKMTLSELSEKHKVSKERIRQIEQEALLKMKQQLIA